MAARLPHCAGVASRHAATGLSCRLVPAAAASRGGQRRIPRAKGRAEQQASALSDRWMDRRTVAERLRATRHPSIPTWAPNGTDRWRAQGCQLLRAPRMDAASLPRRSSVGPLPGGRARACCRPPALMQSTLWVHRVPRAGLLPSAGQPARALAAAGACSGANAGTGGARASVERER